MLVLKLLGHGTKGKRNSESSASAVRYKVREGMIARTVLSSMTF